MSERIVDQVGQVVAPRNRVEISKTSESVCLKVRIRQFVENEVRCWRKVIAVLCVATAQCHPGDGQSISTKCLDGSMTDLRKHHFFLYAMSMNHKRYSRKWCSLKLPRHTVFYAEFLNSFLEFHLKKFSEYVIIPVD